MGSYSRFSWLNGYCDVLVLHLTARSWDETTTKERYFPLRRTVVNLLIHKDGSPWTQENIAQIQLAGCRSLPAIKSWQHSLSPVGKSKSSLTRKRFSPLSHALTTILFSLPGISVLSSFHCSRLQLLQPIPGCHSLHFWFWWCGKFVPDNVWAVVLSFRNIVVLLYNSL